MGRQTALALTGSESRQLNLSILRAIARLLLGVLAAACLTASTIRPGTLVELTHTPSKLLAEATNSPMGDFIPLSRRLVKHAAASISGRLAEGSRQDVLTDVRLVSSPPGRQITALDQRPGMATLVIVGDIMLGRQVAIEMNKRDDFSWPFHHTIDLLQGADLALGNLESPIVSGCPFSSEGMVFCAVPRAVEGLTWAGIDAVGLANNHAYTYNTIGFEQTVNYLRQADLEPIPGGVLVLRQVAGIQVGILAFDDSNAQLDVDQVLAATQAASHQVDVLVGLLHWGVEYQAVPNERQRNVGHALIDAGMDVIAGTHPHCIQPVEDYHGKLIAYSLGNFVFDQMWWEETMQGEVAHLQLVKTPKGMTITHQMIPIEIHGYGQPTVIENGR